MKKSVRLLLLLFFCFITLFSSNSFADGKGAGPTVASATWALSQATTNTTATVGSVTSVNETISTGTGLTATYQDSKGGQRLNQPLSPTYTWIKETSQNESRYIQFDASPVTGNDFTVNNVSFNYGYVGSTSAMNGNVWYSTDNWATRTQLNGSVLVYPNSTMSSFSVSSLSVLVTSGQTFSVRIYPYWVATSTNSTTKFATHNTFVISGTTVASPTYTITTTASPVGSGTVTPSSAGPYLTGTSVTLTATPTPGSFFSNWSGDLTGTTNPSTVTVTSNMNITANFSSFVSVNTTVIGSGTVTPSPAGPTYTPGTSVTLTARSSAGWIFSGWKGDLSGNDSNKVTVVNTTQNDTAVFKKLTNITVVKTGSGSITVTPATGPYVQGTLVTLKAVSSAGWDFAGWSGAITATDSNTTTTAGLTDQNITALFKKFYNVTSSMEGPGAYAITPAPYSGTKYYSGTILTVTPTLNPSWFISKITVNDVSVPVAVPFVDTVTAKQTIKLTVSPKVPQFTLSVSALGDGTVDVTPAPYNGTYDQYTTVFLKAKPNTGSVFTSWTGSITSYATDQQLLMTENKNVYATFDVLKMTETPSNATWSLLSDGSVGTTGDVTAVNELLKGTEINGYSGANNSQRIRMAGTSNTWAANLTAPIDTVYVQFAVSPKTGKTFTVRNVSMNIGAASSSSFKANILYSTKADFSGAVGIDYTTGNNKNYLTSAGTSSVSVNPNLAVKSGETFYLRVYPWNESSSIATGKYLTLQNVIISNVANDGSGGNVAVAPVVDSLSISSITTNSAVCLTKVIADGGADITERGICWATKTTPTTADNKFVANYQASAVGPFSGSLSSLLPGTKYYVRAYAINSAGTSYGREKSFTTLFTYFKLTTTIVGSGKVTATPIRDDNYFESNSSVKLTAVADAGWQFTGWTGDVSGKDAALTFTMNSNKSITASFQKAVGVESNDKLPIQFALYQNYPNPFNPSTKIKYELPSNSYVVIKVYDMLGRETATLLNGNESAGYHEINFDGSNLTSGLYICKIQAGSFSQIKKMLLIK